MIPKGQGSTTGAVQHTRRVISSLYNHRVLLAMTTLTKHHQPGTGQGRGVSVQTKSHRVLQVIQKVHTHTHTVTWWHTHSFCWKTRRWGMSVLACSSRWNNVLLWGLDWQNDFGFCHMLSGMFHFVILEERLCVKLSFVQTMANSGKTV